MPYPESPSEVLVIYERAKVGIKSALPIRISRTGKRKTSLLKAWPAIGMGVTT
jgi:hypothetical protein